MASRSSPRALQPVNKIEAGAALASAAGIGIKPKNTDTGDSFAKRVATGATLPFFEDIATKAGVALGTKKEMTNRLISELEKGALKKADP